MKILIAEDEPVSRKLLSYSIERWGHEVVTACDGREALEKLAQAGSPLVAVIDVIMPGIDGVEVCRTIRKQADLVPPYVILLTTRAEKKDIVIGLEAGANDYVAKPFDHDELRARVNVGVQMVELRQKLAMRVAELEAALSKVRLLEGMLPMCSYCKSIRNDQNYWQAVEDYLAAHWSSPVSHSICPACYDRVVVPQLERMRSRRLASE